LAHNSGVPEESHAPTATVSQCTVISRLVGGCYSLLLADCCGPWLTRVTNDDWSICQRIDIRQLWLHEEFVSILQ
jgi:hypothetical protein